MAEQKIVFDASTKVYAPGYEKNSSARKTSIYELFGYLADTQIERPRASREAAEVYESVYKDTSLTGIIGAIKKARALHDLLSFYPDESEESGNGERYLILNAHYKKFGPLDSDVVFYLLRFAVDKSYKKESRRKGRRSITEHPQQKKRDAFKTWAKCHIDKGAAPRNIQEIKRLDGFDKEWGKDDTIKKWWRSTDGAPALKPGASRS